MSTTALIIRPANIPPVHVLEVDGVRRKFVQRGEGSYYLATDNYHSCDDLELRTGDGRRGGILRHWDQPHWEIYQMHDGTITIQVNRPTLQEAKRGDLFGRWGTQITLSHIERMSLKAALRLARMLATCNPVQGIRLGSRYDAYGIGKIETDIPVDFAWES